MKKFLILTKAVAGILVLTVMSFVVSNSSLAVSGSQGGNYLVTYESSFGGSLDGDTTEWVDEGGSPENAPTPVKSSVLFRFDHWKDQDGEVYDHAEDLIVWDDVTLTAVFVRTVSISPSAGTTLQELDVQIDSGQMFVPWLLENQDNQNEEPEVVVVTYGPGDHGALSGFEVSLVELGGYPSNPPTVIPEDGYVHIGWTDFNETHDTVGEFQINVSKTLTAIYDIHRSHRVWYLPGLHGVLEGTTFESILDGERPTEPLEVIPDDGYNFVGWSDGIATYRDLSVKTILEDTTFTAKYEVVVGEPSDEMITIFYDTAFPGEVIGETMEEIPVGTTAQNIPEFIHAEGYEFGGWKKAGQLIDIDTYIFLETTRLFPSFIVSDDSANAEPVADDAAEEEPDSEEEPDTEEEPISGGADQDQASSEQSADDDNIETSDDSALDNQDDQSEVAASDDSLENDEDFEGDSDTSESGQDENAVEVSNDNGGSESGGSDATMDSGSQSDDGGSDKGDLNNNSTLIIVVIVAIVLMIIILTVLLLSKKNDKLEDTKSKKE